MSGNPPGTNGAQKTLKNHAQCISLSVAAFRCIVIAIAAFAVKLRGADILMGVIAVILILLARGDLKDARARERAQEKPFTTTDDTH